MRVASYIFYTRSLCRVLCIFLNERVPNSSSRNHKKKNRIKESSSESIFFKLSMMKLSCREVRQCVHRGTSRASADKAT
jgi:hypothetical protein